MSRLYGGRLRIDRPASRMSPRVGTSNPASIISVVVFPEPDGPRSVRNSPRRMSRFRSSMTSVWPSNVLSTPTNRTSASWGSCRVTLRRRAAARHVDDRSRHVARAVGQEPHDGLGDLLRLGHAADGQGLEHSLEP